MATKTFQTRVQQKIDTSTNWAKATNFTPLNGEIIIYSDLNKYKVGDGVTKINALPFAYNDSLTTADIITPDLLDVVETSRKVNGHALNADVTVTKSDVGLGNVDNVRQYSASNPPPYPVTSVAGKTGAVTLDKSDVGLGNVDNKSEATIKTDFTGSIVSGNTGFVTGGDAYTALNGKASSTHTHGNISNTGTIGSTANYALYTTTSGVITAGSLQTSSPSTSGSATEFIDTISQDSKGKISATKKSITFPVTSVNSKTGAVSLTYTDVGASASSHTHGNITNAGAIGSTSGYAVYTTTSGVLTAGSLATSDPTASGNSTTFIASISQDDKGKITATKKTVSFPSSTSKYVATNPAMTASSGTCTWAIASGTHGISTDGCIVQVYEVSSGDMIQTNINVSASKTVTLTFASSANIAAGTYRVVIVG